MLTFVLVPGAWHGAWSLEPLARALAERGARAVPVDLPSEDPDAGCERYADVVAGAIPAGIDDAIVVAHSLGGLTAPLVPARHAVGGLVLIAAMLPIPRVSLADQLASDDPPLAPEASGGRDYDEHGRSYWADPARAIELLYGDCDPAMAEWAVSRLRPQGQRPSIEPSPLRRWPETPVHYIRCRDDRLMSAGWTRRVAAERLGVEPVELPGGHNPMLSRPESLADLLVALAG